MEAGPERILLIDGMAMLVRCSKAAARSARLSHEGVPTGALTLFINSVIKHVIKDRWDYVLVAWEGAPMRNWRRRMWPEYRSNRQYPDPLDPDGRMPSARELDQARQFCEAAGIAQDSSPQFEGDDIIAFWWHEFRLRYPDGLITIVTSDKDLWQLIDGCTRCRSIPGDEDQHAGDVEAAFGCSPERMAIVRAMAGDPSDGIPGIRGIGLATAARLAAGSESLPSILRTLYARHPSDELHMAQVFWMISDLRAPAQRPPLRDMDRLRWRPERAGESLSDFLRAWDMQRTLHRIAKGTLPWPDVPPRAQLMSDIEGIPG